MKPGPERPFFDKFGTNSCNVKLHLGRRFFVDLGCEKDSPLSLHSRSRSREHSPPDEQ